MKDLLKLNAEAIYNKDFSIDFKGYSPKEIDEYLDIVISDYLVIEKAYDRLKEENKNLQFEVANLESEIIELKAALSVNEKAPEVSNIDILKRLARLEEIVLNK